MIDPRIRYVLLPGLEGAGHYDGQVLEALGRHAPAELLPLPLLATTDYGALAGRLRPRLPDAPFVLVAESFSGPLAILLARGRPPGLRGLVFSATFARLLHPLRMPALAAARMLDPRRLPVRPATRVMWRRFDSDARRRDLRHDLATVPPEVLSARAIAALEVDLRIGRRIALPSLVLSGSRDLLVPAGATATLLQILADAEHVELDAPHMLLQTRTDEAVRCIADFVARRIAAV